MKSETSTFNPNVERRLDLDDEGGRGESEEPVGVIPGTSGEPLDIEYRPRGVWENPDAASSREGVRIPEKKSLVDLVQKAKTVEDIYQAVGADTKQQIAGFVDFFRKNVDFLLIS